MEISSAVTKETTEETEAADMKVNAKIRVKIRVTEETKTSSKTTEACQCLTPRECLNQDRCQWCSIWWALPCLLCSSSRDPRLILSTFSFHLLTKKNLKSVQHQNNVAAMSEMLYIPWLLKLSLMLNLLEELQVWLLMRTSCRLTDLSLTSSTLTSRLMKPTSSCFPSRTRQLLSPSEERLACVARFDDYWAEREAIEDFKPNYSIWNYCSETSNPPLFSPNWLLIARYESYAYTFNQM